MTSEKFCQERGWGWTGKDTRGEERGPKERRRQERREEERKRKETEFSKNQVWLTCSWKLVCKIEQRVW